MAICFSLFLLVQIFAIIIHPNLGQKSHDARPPISESQPVLQRLSHGQLPVTPADVHKFVDNLKLKKIRERLSGLQSSPFKDRKSVLGFYAWLVNEVYYVWMQWENDHSGPGFEKQKYFVGKDIGEMVQQLEHIWNERSHAEDADEHFKLLREYGYDAHITTRYGQRGENKRPQLSSIILINQAAKHCIVATMGTATRADLQTDAHFNFFRGDTHHGISDVAIKDFKKNVHRKFFEFGIVNMRNFDRITFVGHSLGGAMALVMGIETENYLTRFKDKLKQSASATKFGDTREMPKIEVVTFGQPAVYTRRAVKKKDTALEKMCIIRIADKRDPVKVQTWLTHRGAGNSVTFKFCKKSRASCHNMETTYIPWIATLPDDI